MQKALLDACNHMNCLSHTDYKTLPVQMIDNVEGPVHHLAYERGEDVIVMKGYKFAKAKTAAAAVLGCLALANPAVADQLVKVCNHSTMQLMEYIIASMLIVSQWQCPLQCFNSWKV